MIHDLVEWSWYVSLSAVGIVACAAVLCFGYDAWDAWSYRRKLEREPLDWSIDDGR